MTVFLNEYSRGDFVPVLFVLVFEIGSDLTKADAAVTSRDILVDKDTFGKEIFGHDAIVGAATSPDDGFVFLCCDSVKACGEIELYGGSETTFVFVGIFNQVSEERSGLEYGTLDDWGEIEGFG